MRTMLYRTAGLIAILAAGLVPETAGVVLAQGNAEVSTVLARLGIPPTTLRTVSAADLEVACRPGAPGSRCEVNYATRSDETCRAIAVRVGLERRAEQLKEGGSAGVLTNVHCGGGIFAVFETSDRRAVLGHRDSAGNTSQRQIPL